MEHWVRVSLFGAPWGTCPYATHTAFCACCACLDTLLIERPPDILSDAAALSGSSPYWFDMFAIKIALLSKNYFIGAPWGTRTPNLRIRSARLYPIELMALAKLTIMIIHYLIVLCQSIFLLFISLSLSVPWMESRSFFVFLQGDKCMLDMRMHVKYDKPAVSALS